MFRLGLPAFNPTPIMLVDDTDPLVGTLQRQYHHGFHGSEAPDQVDLRAITTMFSISGMCALEYLYG